MDKKCFFIMEILSAQGASWGLFQQERQTPRWLSASYSVLFLYRFQKKQKNLKIFCGSSFAVYHKDASGAREKANGGGLNTAFETVSVYNLIIDDKAPCFFGSDTLAVFFASFS